MNRRHFISSFLKLAICTLTSYLILKPVDAAWSQEHFAGGDFVLRFQQLFGGQAITDTSDIRLELPTIAENGAAVPLTISSELEQIEHLFIWVEKNPTPLAAEIQLSKNALAYVTARIKMAESSNVIVIAKQGERLLRTQQWVNVMQGGCGTG